MRMDKKENIQKIIKWGLFIMYLLLLIKVILFKYPFAMIRFIIIGNRTSLWNRMLGSNYIPMKTVFYYLAGNESTRIAVDNLLGNIIAFAPLGFFTPMLFNKIDNFRQVLIISFFVSLFFEITQLISGIGSFDIDDIILNLMGAVIGTLVYKLLNYAIKKVANIQL